MGDTATALAEAAHSIREAARVHKRSEFAHRRQARELMRRFDRLRRELATLGITLEDGEDLGGHGHGRRER